MSFNGHGSYQCYFVIPAIPERPAWMDPPIALEDFARSPARSATTMYRETTLHMLDQFGDREGQEGLHPNWKWSPDGKYVAVSICVGCIYLWKASNGELFRACGIEFQDYDANIIALETGIRCVFSKDSSHLLVSVGINARSFVLLTVSNFKLVSFNSNNKYGHVIQRSDVGVTAGRWLNKSRVLLTWLDEAQGSCARVLDFEQSTEAFPADVGAGERFHDWSPSATSYYVVRKVGQHSYEQTHPRTFTLEEQRTVDGEVIRAMNLTIHDSYEEFPSIHISPDQRAVLVEDYNGTSARVVMFN